MSRRNARRGHAAIPYALPAAPVISASGGVVTIGGTITWPPVPGATSYVLQRDGVDVGAIVSPYTELGGDFGPVLTLVAVNAAGRSAASNTLQAVPSVIGPFSDSNYLKSAVNGGVSAMDLGSGTTLVVVLDPNTATPQTNGTGVTPICACTALSSDGWALFLTTNAVCGDAPQVGMFYSHATAPGYTWIQTLGNIARTPGKPIRIVFVDTGATVRVTVNGSPVVTSAAYVGAYTNILSTARLSLGTFNGLGGFPDTINMTAAFAILHRAVSDAEAIAESGLHGSWGIGLATDAACTIEMNATRDYSGGATCVTHGSTPITLTKAGAVPSMDVLSNAFVRVPITTRPEDTGIWESRTACNGIAYHGVTQQARWLIDTDAESIIVEQIVTEGAPYYTDVACRIVGGVTPTPVAPLGGYTTPYPLSGYMALGTGGTAKVVEVVASVQSNIASPLTFLGGFPYAISVPHGRTATVRAATVPTRRLVVYSDSLAAERPSNPEINGPFGLLRLDYPGQVTVDAALNRSLYDDTVGGGPGLAALVALLAAECDGSVTNELWLMIGLEDHWRTLWASPAAFTTAYNAFLVALRAAVPSAAFYVQTRGTADGPYATNGLGDTIAQWRTAQANAAVGISNCTVVDGATMYALSDLAADSATTPNKVHVSTAGAAVYKAAIKAALGY